MGGRGEVVVEVVVWWGDAMRCGEMFSFALLF